MMTTTTLTDRQERFVMEYLADQNASAAARRCGYSLQSAAWQGSSLMRIPAVRDRIRAEMRDILAELGVTLVDLVKERVKAAYFRNGRMFGEDGRLLAIEDLPRDMLELLEIAVVWRGDKPVLRLKQPSRDRALSALEKLLDRLDRQDEAYFEQREAEQAEAPPVLPPRPAIFQVDPPPEPGEGVESDPGFAEKHGDLLGLDEPDPLDTFAATSSGRTEEGCEIPQKPVDLSGSAEPAPEKPHHLSSLPRWPRKTPEEYQAEIARAKAGMAQARKRLAEIMEPL